jgi:hypothetical protein
LIYKDLKVIALGNPSSKVELRHEITSLTYVTWLLAETNVMSFSPFLVPSLL